LLVVLHLLSSNSQDVLVAQLSQILKIQAPADPFTSTSVLVQSDGMANWLKLQLSSKLGQCSHIEFLMPSNFLWQCYRKTLPEVPERSPFAREQLRWRIAQYLAEHINQPEYLPLNEYLQKNPGDNAQVQLAEAITDIFDHYLMYRPDWLMAWESGDFSLFNELGADLRWQGMLWKAIVTSIPTELRWHRANIAEAFINSVSAADLPEQLYVFGISNMPPIMLQQLHAISEHCEVYLFWQNPCSEFWQELANPKSRAAITAALESEFQEDNFQSDNTLLSNLGQHGRDFVHQLIELDIFGGNHDIRFNLDQKVDLGRETLLAHIQHDVLSLQQTRHHYDPSIKLSTSYSSAREIQALRDYVLQQLEADPSLTPGDFVVMVPNIEDYAPFFATLFNPVGSSTYLPIAISDRAEISEQPIYQAIQQLLGLSRSRATRTDIFNLLEIAAVRAKFSIAEEQVAQLRDWCQQANVYWGFNDEHWQQHGNPATGRHHWEFAIERWLQSLIFADSAAPFNDAVGGIRISGTQSELLSNFIEFLDTLKRTFAIQQGEKSPAEWHQIMIESFNKLIASDHEDAEYLPQIYRKIDDYFVAISNAEFTQAVSFASVSQPLLSELTSVRNSQRFAAGRINICTFLPMRSIPFRVVCMLGMGSEQIPRRIEAQQFDLSLRQPRIGDRHPTREDRYLFLEGILAAEDALYISWIGHSIKTNEEQPPSILVSELLDTLVETTALSRAELEAKAICNHPLQSFNSSYYLPDSPLFSYDERWLLTPSRAENFDSQSLEVTKHDEIDINDLVTFYKNPLRTFLKHLGVSKHYSDSELSDDERFEINSLERWKIYQKINEQGLSGAIAPVLRRFELSGESPAAAIGTNVSANLSRDFNESIKDLQPLLPLHPKQATRRLSVPSREGRCSANLDDGEIILSGTLPYYQTANGNLVIQFANHSSSNNPKYALQLRIHQAFLCAAKLNCTAVLIEKGGAKKAAAMSAEEALKLLSGWVDLYQYGLTLPLPLDASIASKVVQEKSVNESDFKDELEARISQFTDWQDAIVQHAETFMGDTNLCFEAGAKL
jgi:exodeoxyribonuclease V gamma subunit